MGTSALIDLAPVTRDDPLRVRVHYDGAEHTRRALETLIARDGLDTVVSTFAAQPSRFWLGLDTDLRERPAYADTYPPDWEVEVVPGYGLLFVGDNTIEKSRDLAFFDTDAWEYGFWRVTASGGVRWAES